MLNIMTSSQKLKSQNVEDVIFEEIKLYYESFHSLVFFSSHLSTVYIHLRQLCTAHQLPLRRHRKKRLLQTQQALGGAGHQVVSHYKVRLFLILTVTLE